MSRRDILADLIEKTKQQRFDKKMARDELEDATERLDEKWKEILQTGAMGNFARTVKDKSVINSGKDDYDNLVCGFFFFNLSDSDSDHLIKRGGAEAQVSGNDYFMLDFFKSRTFMIRKDGNKSTNG